MNRRITVLQTVALPLGYVAENVTNVTDFRETFSFNILFLKNLKTVFRKTVTTVTVWFLFLRFFQLQTAR